MTVDFTGVNKANSSTNDDKREWKREACTLKVVWPKDRGVVQRAAGLDW